MNCIQHSFKLNKRTVKPVTHYFNISVSKIGIVKKKNTKIHFWKLAKIQYDPIKANRVD